MADDLFKAMAALQSGMRDFATSRAINQANDVVRELNAQEMEDGQRRAQIQQVANQLAAKLFSVGAPAATALGASESMVPQDPAKGIQSPFQGLLSSDPGVRSTSQRFIDEERALDREKLGAARESKAAGAEDKKLETLRKAIEGFDKREQKNIEAVSESMRAIAALRSGNSQLAYELARGALVKSVDPRPSDEDFKRTAPSKALRTKVERAYSEFIEGRPLPSDKKVVGAVTRAMEAAATRSIKRRAKGFVIANRGLFPGVRPEDLEERILARSLGVEASSMDAGIQASSSPSGPAPISKYLKY